MIKRAGYTLGNRKVAIIGAGYVGSSIAYALALGDIAREIVIGAEIIAAKGRTRYGIATCVCQLADAIINQRPTIACVSSTLHGEHGVRDVALSVPSVTGPAGVQQRIRERWAPEEYRAFFDAVEKERNTLTAIEVGG